MKIFNKIVCALICISMMLGILASCDVKIDLGDEIYVSDFYLNEDYELVAVLDDESEINLGKFAKKGSDEIGIESIKINGSGKISAKMSDGTTVSVGHAFAKDSENENDIKSIELNKNDELIVKRRGGKEQNLGNVYDLIACAKHEPAPAVRENEVAATEEKEGSYDEVVYCKNCGAELERKSHIIPKPDAPTPGPGGKHSITVTTESAEKIFDGKPLTNGSYVVKGEENLKKDHTLNVTVTGSQTEVGSSDNYAVVKVFDKHGKDVTDKYEIILELGTLTVLEDSGTVDPGVKPAIRVVTASEEKVYDGYPLEKAGYEIFGSEHIAAGHSLIVNVTGSQTEIGSSANYASVLVLDEFGNDVTDKYEIILELGTLTVLEAVASEGKLTVTVNDAEKIYDGKPLVPNGYSTMGEEYLPEGATYKVTLTGSITDVGVTESSAVVTVFDKDGNDITDTVKIVVNGGTLAVLRREINIISASAEKIYDGKPLVNDEYTLMGDLPEGTFLNVVISGSQTEIGSSVNMIESVRIYDYNGFDVSENYYITLEYGTLTVIGGNNPVDPPVSENTTYKVEHYFENLNGGYDLFKTEDLSAKVGESVSATAISEPHFVFDEANSIRNGVATEDGSLVLRMIYSRRTYTVTVGDPDPLGRVLGDGQYKYGETVTVSAEAHKLGVFKGWYDDNGLLSEEMSVTVTIESNIIANFAPCEDLASFRYLVSNSEVIITGIIDKNTVDVRIPDGVTEIDDNAFLGNGKLRSVYIPKSVTTIGTSAFFRCYALSEVHIEDIAS